MKPLSHKLRLLISFFFAALFISLFILLSQNTFAAVTWHENEEWPLHGVHNPYELSKNDFDIARKAGLLHSLHWPVAVTGSLIPIAPFEFIMGYVQTKLGLHKYPMQEGKDIYYVPFKNGERPNDRMGFTTIERDQAEGLTFSCAACHSGKLFGKTIIGLNNRFPGANSLFVMALGGVKKVSPEMLKKFLNATDAEVEMYKKTTERLAFVESKKPRAKGLDTSLAHVALSLSHRESDEFASLTNTYRNRPRFEPLRYTVADSKPLVWWNVKYKNKWLADGSLVSGNPIFTNFIWNEIGRGTDLNELSAWFDANADTIKQLTTAVYSSQAPLITDFFSAQKINLQNAQSGERLFKNKCMACHGEYIKGWSLDNSSQLSLKENLKTFEVKYHSNTPIRNVGTDPNRFNAMTSLLQLNELQISKDNNILIRKQNGYVPPPLVGVWARFPYLHNNSIPNLCELLKPAKSRVTFYYSGDVVSRERHYDFNCGGYPIRQKTPVEWQNRAEHRFDTQMQGLSNQGHDFDFKKLTPNDRHNLIQFLLTL